MNNKITVILTLYKTPIKKLNNLNCYKKFPLIIFEQEGSIESKKKIIKNLKRNFKYFYSNKNIGLSRASNFLLKKVKTKYMLFTQPDIFIDNKSILNLSKIFKKDKNIIFITPTISKKFENFKKKKIIYKKKIKAACMMCNVKKLKKIGFFDEDYFLYWEDIDLMKKVNSFKYKMVVMNNVFAKHMSSQSSENNFKTEYLRRSNFIYGELVFDYKHRKLRFIKIFRKFLQNLVFFFFNIVKFQLKKSFINLSIIFGIFKFILYYLKK